MTIPVTAARALIDTALNGETSYTGNLPGWRSRPPMPSLYHRYPARELLQCCGTQDNSKAYDAWMTVQHAQNAA